MRPSRAYPWLTQNRNRTRILCTLTQPLTASQLGRRLDINVSTCMSVLADLRKAGICICMNPQANKSRLYGLTPTGHRFQKHARREFGLTPVVPIAFEIDWERYGFACFSHRVAIVSVLSRPLTAAEIKRRIRRLDASARISCNNIRDALKVLCRRRVVRRVTIGWDRRTRYALTEACEAFPDLLRAAHWTREEQFDWRRP